MKLELETADTFSGGIKETAAFKVEMNAMMFHSVIDGIYADKIRSPIRELCTNARDGHAANGNLGEPFDVFLPSALNPVFKVRDYGVGLSHDDIMGLYTTMFASSKRDSNDAVGMIGLGSKSPFAYTSAFTVTSWNDGVENVYSAYIGDEGVPQIALMHTKDSNARTGMEISMPVKSEDITKFRTGAPEALFGFSPFPNILNEQFKRVVPVPIYEGPGWAMYQYSSNGSTGVHFRSMMARQGCVLYPITTASIGTLSPGEGAMYSWPIVIDFPIGELDVATSREALGYTTKTITNIKRRVDEVRHEMAKLLQTQIDECPSYLAACHLMVTSMTNYGPQRDLWNGLASALTYKGRGLTSMFGVSAIMKDKWEICPIDASKTTMGVARTSLTFRSKAMTNVRYSPQQLMEQQLLVVEYPDCEIGTSRMRKLMLENTAHKNLIWARVQSKEVFEELHEKLGWMPAVDLANYDRLIIPRNDGIREQKRFRYLPVSKDWQNSHNGKYEVRIPSKDMLTIRQAEGMFHLSPEMEKMDWYAMEGMLRNALLAGLLVEGQRIYFLNMTHKDIADTQVTKLKDHLTQQIQTKGFKDLAALTNASDKNRKIEFAKTLMTRMGTRKAPSDLKKYAALAAAQPTIPITNANPLHRVSKIVCPAELDEEVKKSDSLYEQHDILLAKYPLLSAAISSESSFQHYMELLTK